MKRSLTAALLLLLSGGFAFSQKQTCPRPDCPNQGVCQRKGRGDSNGSCPRNGQNQPQSRSKAGTQGPQRGAIGWGQR